MNRSSDRSHLATRLVALLLAVHTAAVGWIALRSSPTVDEVAHLPAGISHWRFGRFELYRVNPPLVRAVAALPVLATDVKTDWSAFTDDPFRRPEFGVGKRFCALNGPNLDWYFAIARWVCLPFTLLGGVICWRWARELYGDKAGITSLILWCFSPSILGNAGLITPDLAAASCGAWAGYCFWRWLRSPSVATVVAAGLTLGIAELTKMTWVILFALWPVLWAVWRVRSNAGVACRLDPGQRLGGPSKNPPVLQLLVILVTGVYVINLGYAFEGSFTPLKRFTFISKTLGGPDAHEKPGNRFGDGVLGEIAVPVPANYLRGIDVQRYEFEQRQWSYLRGERKKGGWWYYYLYAIAVKVPCGTLLLGTCVLSFRCKLRWAGCSRLDELVLLSPAIALLVFVSSQTGFSRYFRYVLPMMPFVFVWLGQAGECIARAPRWRSCIVGFLICWSATSSLAVYPHSLSYFNELAGGPFGGPRHLLDANIDWGQDLWYLKDWRDSHPDARPLFLQYFGDWDPSATGIQFTSIPTLSTDYETRRSRFYRDPLPGWYAIDVNDLYDYQDNGATSESTAYLRKYEPVAYIGYTIRVYRLTEPDVAKLIASTMEVPAERCR